MKANSSHVPSDSDISVNMTRLELPGCVDDAGQMSAHGEMPMAMAMARIRNVHGGPMVLSLLLKAILRLALAMALAIHNASCVAFSLHHDIIYPTHCIPISLIQPKRRSDDYTKESQKKVIL